MPRSAAVAVLLAATVACSRPASPSNDADAAPGPSTRAPVASAPTLPAAPSEGAVAETRPNAGEARRWITAQRGRDEPLTRDAELLARHFGERARGPLAAQRVALAGDRTATLVTLPTGEQPLVLVHDAAGLLWSKERPTAGMMPPALHLALVPHTSGGPALAAFDAPTKLVVARAWSDDGSPFADFELMHVDACDALSAAYWPRRGWVVVAARLGGARAQLLREEGTLAWGPAGVEVGSPWRAPAPVTIVADAASSVLLVQHASGAPGGPADRVVAQRIDRSGAAVWAAPVDLGAVPHVPDPRERLAATPLADGVIRVDLPRGALAGRARAVELAPSGAIVARER